MVEAGAKVTIGDVLDDLPTGPKEAKPTVLSIEDEAIVVAFRRHTLLPLDDLPLRVADNDPASDPILAPSLSTTPRYLPPAGC